MLHLVLCFTVWAIISTYLGWRFIAIAKGAFQHLKRLHQIPCSNCTYFTRDYRLKCTVQPMVAMSEDAIGCRDFMPQKGNRHNEPKFSGGCFAINQCPSSTSKSKPSVVQLKLPQVNHENISLSSTSLD
jgi:hypothetical protein